MFGMTDQQIFLGLALVSVLGYVYFVRNPHIIRAEKFYASQLSDAYPVYIPDPWPRDTRRGTY